MILFQANNFKLIFSSFQKNENYKGTEPIAIDLLKDTHCSARKNVDF